MRYAFIDAHRAGYPVPMMCELLDVSRSGYHAWRGRGPSPRELENVRLETHIRAIHAASDGAYGSPRVHEELRAQGNVVSLNRVRRLMKKNSDRGATQAEVSRHHRFAAQAAGGAQSARAELRGRAA